ncbi:amino acid transporter [Natronolimnohabitans innermongolicus]|uniref:Amino acid permease n=1 Tax=Natronolimnohabitans innermongolicus JCM 12255 TaxID=1227499 RepID=L9WU80_9EURY|nr:amino acid transporter [Natronolimnohabitans innermongolicus]ELY52977.1 amino acid permease [Natronolimnohabitans innermongolicus JCM 12255]
MDHGDDSDLQRDLGSFAVFTIASGTMIGAGIFVLPGPAAEGAGPASALSFGIAGLIALVATMCAVELATAMPRAGGPYYFASRAMGPLVGTIVGFGAWLALIFKGAFALVGLGWYVTELWAVPVLAVAVVGGLLLTLLNWIGAEETGHLQNLVVIGLVGILAVFAGGGLLAADTDNWAPFVTTGVEGVVTTTGLVFISYLGIVKATAVAEEVRDPGRTLPRALFAAVIFVTLLYVGVMLIVTGVMPVAEIAESTAPVPDAGRLFLGSLGGAVIALAGVFATVSTANAAVLSSSRFPFAMSRDGLVTSRLSRPSPRFGTPARSIWLTGALMLALAVLFDVEGLAKLGGTFGILVFALLNVTVVLLRSARPEWYDPAYSVPLSPVLPLAGAGAALLLIPFMGLQSQISAIAFVVIGIGWYYLQTRIGEPVEPDHDLRDQLLGAQYRRSIEEKRSRIGTPSAAGPHVLVETADGEANPHLLTAMRSFADRFDADLDVLTITTVPPRRPLAEATHDVDDDWRERLERELALRDHAVVFDHVRTRDRTEAVLESVTERTELVLVDWRDPIENGHLRESHVDELLQSAFPVRLAVLKPRGTAEIDDIVVATETGPYDRAEVELADAIATVTGASLTLVKAVPDDASEEAVASARGYLDELTAVLSSPAETELLRTADVDAALVDRADRTDLLVMGAPTHPDRVSAFFGRTTDAVVAETETSVLVVKEPGVRIPFTRRLWRRLRRFGVRPS